MHTFFINTSQKDLKDYEVLFDIYHENKSLVSMRCPIADWYNEEKGYMNCFKQMSDMIEGYVELNNSYNLIIYIDLSENKEYSSISRDAYHDKDRDECCKAMHILFTHVINESIIAKLDDAGRRPQNVLIMFGEDKKFTTFKVAPNDPSIIGIMKYIFGFIGIPNDQTVESIAKRVLEKESSNAIAEFEKEVVKVFGKEILPGIRKEYQEDLSLWYESVINEANVEKANLDLFNRISKINVAEADRMGIESVSCPYDCYACNLNKSSLALSQLNISLHVLKCVESNSIYEIDSSESYKEVIDFHVYSIEEIVPILKSKERLYEKKLIEIDSLNKSYSDLKLAPKLAVFDHDKFGLNAHGDRATRYIINDVSGSDGQNEKDIDKTAVLGKNKEIVSVAVERSSMFSEEEYTTFEGSVARKDESLLKDDVSPNEYITQALHIKNEHTVFLRNLKKHVDTVLSNYSSRGKNNAPALLQVGGYKYAKSGKENRALEVIEDVSKRSYDNIVNEYMEFNAARSIALASIDEQCDWFVSKVHQITESLRKIKIVSVALLIGMLVLYIPYLVVQAESIFSSSYTFLVALLSLFVPIVLLYLVFCFASINQKKQYKKAWTIFKEKVDAAIEKNILAARSYDQLLSVMVPSLRWVYEYKLDVGYFTDCCRIAEAKIEHHRSKLSARKKAIYNILSDLEAKQSVGGLEYDDIVPQEDIDYNCSFCSGDKNKKVYSIIDKVFLISNETEGENSSK